MRKDMNKYHAKRTLPWWGKLLLVVCCTALCAALAWVYCEKIATPRYADTYRASLSILDTEPLMSGGNSEFTTRSLNIRGGLLDELGNVGSKNKGLFYRNIADALNGDGEVVLKPRELKDMISVADDTGDTTGQSILITVKHSDPVLAEKIARAASEQFGIMIFGGAPASEQAEIEIAAQEDPGVWQVRFRVTDEAVGSLPDKFYGVTLDLITGLTHDLANDAFCEAVAARAGLNVSAKEIRNRLHVTTTADPAVLTLTASWTDGETAQRLLQAGGEEMAASVFGGEYNPWQAAVSEPTLVSERVREWPSTLPIVLITALAALIISYAVFSRQSLFDTAIVIFFVLFTFICVFPFYYLFINTISANDLVAGGQINFWPQGLHLKNYERIIGQEDLINALVVTVSRTILGTVLMVLTSAWAGYLVTKQKMWRRSFWYRALVITMYFNAGLIPWYTNMLMLGLTGNFLAYIIPGMVAPYNIILVKTYIESIPASLEESAVIDGASTSRVFLRIILPLSIPILATIAIFGAVGNWNSFQDSLLLMSSAPHLYTLQHRLYIYLNQTTSINTEQISEQMAQNLLNTGVTTKYTIAMITIIPILLVYPFMQRYFVKGIMLGAVKG